MNGKMNLMIGIIVVAFVGLVIAGAAIDVWKTRNRTIVEEGKNYVIYEVNKPACQIFEFTNVLRGRTDEDKYKVSRKYLVKVIKTTDKAKVLEYFERYGKRDVATWGRVGNGVYYTYFVNILTDNYKKVKMFFGDDFR